jgi:hypothetical protein
MTDDRQNRDRSRTLARVKCRGCLLHSWLAAVVCLVFLCFIPSAQGQSFGPPVRSEVILQFFDSQKNVRFTLAAYYASWENPFRATITTVSPALGFQRVSRSVRIIPDTPASPLFEGTYTISKRWRVGFWYNPIRGERIQQSVQVADVPVSLNLERDTDLMDLHVTYYGYRGLSAQLGYYRESGTIHDRSATPQPDRDYGLVSWNVWVTQPWEVHVRGRLLTPFISFGYHPSNGLNHAVSFMTGAGLTLTERWSLSGSVWLFDLSHAATRVTGGVEYRF